MLENIWGKGNSWVPRVTGLAQTTVENWSYPLNGSYECRDPTILLLGIFSTEEHLYVLKKKKKC